jgi:hypothetical protein
MPACADQLTLVNPDFHEEVFSPGNVYKFSCDLTDFSTALVSQAPVEMTK